MEISLKISKPLISFDLNISLACGNKSLLVVIGPSGAGKTMLMRLIAGLERPKTGRIVYGNQTWVDTDSGVFLSPQSRCVGYVFQDYPLFPHLNIRRNVAFAAGISTDVDHMMKDFDIWHLRHRKPQEISGGERQRCAICQALVRQPRVLLLDEPFSALDVIARRTLRDLVVGLKSRLDIPMIYVTHDINEALAIADDILPIVNGRADHDWIQQPVERDERDNVIPMKAARRPRLSLNY